MKIQTIRERIKEAGSVAATARAYSVQASQIRRWEAAGALVIDGEVYTPRRINKNKRGD